MPFHTWFEAGNLFRRSRVLQVVKRAAVGDGGNHGSQLQRRHGDAFSEGAHFPYATELGRNLFLRVGAHLLARDFVSREFAQSVLVGVEADFLKSQAASQSLEVGVVGMSQGSSKIHAAAAAQGNFCVFCNQVFAQGSQGHRQLDGRARLRAT